MSAVNEGALQGLGSRDKAKHAFVVTAPAAPLKPGFLATAIIEEDARSKGKRAAQTGFALAVQIAIVGVLLLIPLIFTEGLDLYKAQSAILLAPPPPAAPPPPMHAEAAARPSFIKANLTAPTMIPKKIVQTVADPGGAAPAIAGMTGGVPGGIGDVLGGAAAGPVPPPPPAAVERPKGPIRITTGMKEPQLLYAPPVVYSPVARMARVEGTVVVEAIIDEQGNVTQVHYVSGPALLSDSAMKAVAGRRYAPTYLDGQVVAVRLTVNVEYKLH